MARRSALLLLLAVPCFLFSVYRLDARPRKDASPEMEVVVPLLVQVVMAGGDRYLAANFGGIRAAISNTERMDADAFRVLGKVQRDVAWLNPAHEDNYYIGSAILPWNGQFEAGQYVLRQAIDARPFDMWPPFYYGFDLYHFNRDSEGGAEWLRVGASRTQDEMESLMLNNMAARWVRNGTEPQIAIRILQAMAETARSAGFAAHLRKHVQRLQNIVAVEAAAKTYSEHQGKPPGSIEDLVRSQALQAIPKDPFGGRYYLDDQGKPKIQEKQG